MELLTKTNETMKRILLNEVRRANGCNERDAREIITDAAANYHDRLNKGKSVYLSNEMQIDLGIDYPDDEIVEAMWDEVKNIRTDRDILLPFLENFAESYSCNKSSMKDMMIMSLEKENRDKYELLDELYFYVRGFSRETIENI